MAQQLRNPSRLERVVNWIKRDMPEKLYVFERPIPENQYPFQWQYSAYIFKPIFRWIERQGVHFYNKILNKTELGLLPKEWNPRVHGIYCHWRYYGTNVDVPVWDVKVKDVGKWLGRRDYSFRAMWRETIRVWNKFLYDYYKGPIFTGPIDYFFLMLFHYLFMMWLVRTVILKIREPRKWALYYW